MPALIEDPEIQRILNPPEQSTRWENDLQRLKSGDVSLTRRSAGENSIRAFQRLMVFLGYSTASSGAFLIDGDFGRGTNRGLAQFQYEHGLAGNGINRQVLTYPCNWRSARRLITAIPDVRLDVDTLEKMLETAKQAIRDNAVNGGDFEEALFQLNAVDERALLSCRAINQRYGTTAEAAADAVREARAIVIQPEWILAIIKQETSGVVRPRFEQHWLSKLARREPEADLAELRYRSMSFGLGQIMGFNFERVGTSSAFELYTLPLSSQIISIARFLTLRRRVRAVVKKSDPTPEDFETVARYYNGSGYARHHYHERLARWFREFKLLRA